ncbi:YesL family protein [Thalassobacillus pellis]|uniref:YesL family protein n=1 Tax=Thalassobacillus pellis TaxID=748008 RepID=UPI001960913A|nr:YesL family protein [Thalassobacillus pellis]MBM7551524.1 putative membrane protein YesL [Thalassobacillus pellis]
MGWKNGLVRVSEWIMKMAYINLLWIAFTLTGLVVLGFLPSTAAMFAIMRKWMKGQLGKSIFKQFWGFYKKEFLKSNIAGLGLVIVGYVLYFDLFIYDFGQQQTLKILVFILAAFYLLTVAYFFPLYVHHELKWHQYMKLAVLTAFSSPLRGLLMVFLGYGIYYLMSMSPGLLLFFYGSTIAYLWLMISLPLFEKLVKKSAKSDKRNLQFKQGRA